MRHIIDLRKLRHGKFGRWKVLSFAGVDKHANALWKCKCRCGKVKIVTGSALRTGLSNSCGCLRSEISSKVNKVHGMSHTPTFVSWIEMRKRCYNKKVISYKNYGGRGVRVCIRWLLDFRNFLKDMGTRPRGRTLHRLEVNKNYTPSNCVWATYSQQVANRRISSNGIF